MALAVKVKCQKCDWTGTRETGYAHKCSETAGSTIDLSKPSAADIFAYDYDAYLASIPVTTVPEGRASNNNASSSASAPAATASAPASLAGQRPQSKMTKLSPPGGSQPWKKYNLNKEDYEQLVKMFKFFQEGNEELSRPLITKLLRWMNFAQTPQVIAGIFSEMDVDNNGYLSVDEFLSWVSKNKPSKEALFGLTIAEYGKAMSEFKLFDLDEDAYLNAEEFGDLMVSTGQCTDPEKISQIFEALDTRKTGVVSLMEYINYKKNPPVITSFRNEL